MDQIQKFEALLAISEATSGALSLNLTLQKVFDKVIEVTQFSKGAIRILDQSNNCFRMMANVGAPAQLVKDLETIPTDQSFQGDVFESKEPVFTSDLPMDHRLISESEIDAGMLTLVCIPLIASDEVVGTMELVSEESLEISEDDLRWFKTIGRQVGCNIRVMQLSEHKQDLAVIQERTRLSTELHDNLAQLIASFRIRTEEAQICIKKGEIACAEDKLVEIESLARDLSASLRDEILGLRVADLSEQGLIPVLTGHIDRFQRQWGIETRLLVDEIHPWEATASVEIQVLRILQEALSNIRRHARASMAEVSILAKDGIWRISVEDNGVGFNPSEIMDDQMGLRIMKERASSIGGYILIDANPDRGTKILFEVPKSSIHQKLIKERL